MRRRWTATTTRLCQILAIFGLAYFILGILGPALKYNIVPHPHPILLVDHDDHARINTSSSPTVNLVIASQARDNLAWTSTLSGGNFTILRYVNDDPFAKYKPPSSKGREALMYFAYLYDFYDSLPDISIFIHAEETPWHVEGTLMQNTSFALSQLDLDQVIDRGYFNLRVTWRAACPDWIDTTKTFDDWDKWEEPYMREAWTSNFGSDALVPDKLGGPCCSQFAVTRSAIHSRPREQYKKSRDWIMSSSWSDSILGRVWEHMWPFLFTGQASDCQHVERASLCEMYGVCFARQEELDGYKELWEERERLKEAMSFFRAVWRPGRAKEARREMERVKGEIERQMLVAWGRGRDSGGRAEVIADAESAVG